MVGKYKINEVAKDFGKAAKDITDLLSRFFDEPKKTQAALENKELDIIFDVLTQENQVESFDAFFAMQKPAEKKAAEKKPAEKKEEKAKPAPKKAEEKKPEAKSNEKQASAKPAKEAKPAEKKAEKAPAKAPEKKPSQEPNLNPFKKKEKNFC